MDRVTVGEIISYMEERYPPETAESWDKVGLIVGGRNDEAARVLLAVDPVPEVVAQAVDGGYDLLITHHPLYLRGTSYVSDDDAKGRMVRDLIRAGVGLYAAHTNGDVNRGGVADALAELFGLEQTRPLVPGEEQGVGLGRIGTVRPQKLSEFARLVADRLPAGPAGVYVGGDLDRVISVVAVSGGSGDSFLDTVGELGADVYVTADLRHHPSSEHLMNRGPALICGSHWATEWPWLPHLARQLEETFADRIDVDVSTLVTEPWSLHLPTKGLCQ